jgi:hypothetical protein
MSNYKDGRSFIKHYCKICKINEISYPNWRIGTQKCKSCATKERFNDPKNHPCFGKKLSIETKQKMKLTHIGLLIGELNGMWQGGISFLPYSPEFTESLKEKIRDRDNHECKICHKTEKELDRKLDIHHIDYNKKNSNEENLISLCLRCHLKTQGNRDYWFAYLSELIKDLTTEYCKT